MLLYALDKRLVKTYLVIINLRPYIVLIQGPETRQKNQNQGSEVKVDNTKWVDTGISKTRQRTRIEMTRGYRKRGRDHGSSWLVYRLTDSSVNNCTVTLMWQVSFQRNPLLDANVYNVITGHWYHNTREAREKHARFPEMLKNLRSHTQKSFVND